MRTYVSSLAVVDRPFFVLAVGAAAGLASGLLGVGGGIVLVPILVMMLGFTQHEAHGTSLAAIVPIAVVGAVAFASAGYVAYGIAACLAAGSLVGAPVGARLLRRTSESSLKIMFGLLLLVVAVELLWP
jgi:uncharacterized membrane protein YfcA